MAAPRSAGSARDSSFPMTGFMRVLLLGKFLPIASLPVRLRRLGALRSTWCLSSVFPSTACDLPRSHSLRFQLGRLHHVGPALQVGVEALAERIGAFHG